MSCQVSGSPSEYGLRPAQKPFCRDHQMLFILQRRFWATWAAQKQEILGKFACVIRPTLARRCSMVYFRAMDYHYCGVVTNRHIEDQTGTPCGRSASTLCYDCGTSLCETHTDVCDLCKEKFCSSCLGFHLDEHSKRSATGHLPAVRKKTAWTVNSNKDRQCANSTPSSIHAHEEALSEKAES